MPLTTRVIRAEPLTEERFSPYGQVIARGDMVMELKGEEMFHLNVLHYERQALRCDHLNRHHRATQALVALAGKPTLLVVASGEHDEVAYLESDLGVVVEVTL
jgi:ureidoglycolate hydrolase